THEVKNPLTGIIGFAQIANMKLTVGSAPLGPALAARNQPDAKAIDTVRECVQGIETESRRCLEIVQNFLRFARRERVEFAPTDLNKVLDEVAKLVRHQLSVNGVKLVLDAEALPQVQANAGQLEQVLLNLTINAQQAIVEAKQSCGARPD